MNTGALLLQTEDGGLVEAPRLATDVVMTVNGTIARVTVTQRFENPSDRWLEGIYVFPLPEQSAVDALRMEIGDRVIEGEIKGRDEAKQAYEAAKDAGQKASLVEQERPNIFTNSVANIGPHEAIVVRIEYQETVKQDGGVYSLRFPLVVAPRYNPKASEVTSVDLRRQALGRRSRSRPRPHHAAGARSRQGPQDQPGVDPSEAQCGLRASATSKARSIRSRSTGPATRRRRLTPRRRHACPPTRISSSSGARRPPRCRRPRCSMRPSTARTICSPWSRRPRWTARQSSCRAS